MTVKTRVFQILIYTLICHQTTATLISVVPQGKPLQNGKVEVSYLPVGSDDVLETVHFANEAKSDVTDDADYDELIDASSAPEGLSEVKKLEQVDEPSSPETSIIPSTESSSSSTSVVETSTSSSEPTSTKPSTESVKTSTSSPTTTAGVTSSSPTNSPTSLPKLCDELLTSDTELKFPTDEMPLTKPYKKSWCFDLADGPGVEIYVDHINIDPQTDYIKIMAGDGEDEDEQTTLITGSYKNLTFNIIHTNKAFILFDYTEKKKTSDPPTVNCSFKLSVRSYGEHPTTTTPASTTLPSYIGRMKTITKSLSVSHDVQHNDTTVWETLRDALVESTNLWIKAHNFSNFLEECKRENIVFDRITPCPLSWPNHQDCVRLEFGVPLNETDYDEELDPQLSSEYELSEDHLEEMWLEFGKAKLEEIGMPEYFLPNKTYVLLIWVSVSVVIVILFCIVLYAIWKSDLFKDYKRMDEEPETEKTEDENKKQTDITMFPTPFLYGEDECPPEFSHEYGKIDSELTQWHVNSNYPVAHDMNDQDTTIYDVRSQPTSPTATTRQRTGVRFCTDVENIEDQRAGAYADTLMLDTNTSDTYHGYRDSQC